MHFSEQIKKIRTDHDLTQEQLALKLNVSRQTISSWENDRNLPDIEMIVAIAKLFNLSLDQLILGGCNMTEKLIKDGSETRKAKLNLRMIILGTCLFLIGATCIFLKAITVEYVDSNGFLHENFFFLPIGFFFLFGGMMTFCIVGVKSIFSRLKNQHYKSKIK